MKKLFILDLDGVVINSILCGIPRLEKSAREIGLPIDNDFPAFVRSLWGKHLETELIPALTSKYGWSQEDGSQVLSNFFAYDHKHPSPLIPGSKEAILNLRKHGELMVVTNRGEADVESIMRPDLLKPEWFSYLQHAGNGLPSKPNPLTMERIMSQVNGHVIYYVGDSVRDDFNMVIEAEKTFQKKISFFGVLSGVSTRNDFIGAGVEKDKIFCNLLLASHAINKQKI